jgi:hypothetical protein
MNVLNCVINPRWEDQSIWKREQDGRLGKGNNELGCLDKLRHWYFETLRCKKLQLLLYCGSESNNTKNMSI